MKNRDSAIDFVKGVSIILMVWGHATTDWPAANAVTRWFSLFHMPVFLFVAGWFYDSTCSQEWSRVGRFIVKKIKRLWWPVFFWTLVLVLCHNFLLERNFYASDNRILGLRNGRLTNCAVSYRYTWEIAFWRIVDAFRMYRLDVLVGACWFVRALFFVLCFYCVGDGLLRCCARRFRMEERMQTLVGQSVVAVTAVLMARYYVPHQLASVIRYFGGIQVLTCYFLFHVGVLLRVWNARSDRLGGRCRFVVVLSCLCLTILMSRFGMISLVSVKFPSVWFLVVGSLAGWFMLTSMACGVVAFVGRHTMSILIFHFGAFKIVNYIGVACRGDDSILLAGWPTAYSGLWWCLAYASVGVGVPLVLSVVYTRIKTALKDCHRTLREG